jgi:hypothetical protein
VLGDPGGPQIQDREVLDLKEPRGEVEGERLLIQAGWRERPRGQKAQESKGPDPS